MIVTDLGAAYAPQTVYSTTKLAYSVPLAPIAPQLTSLVRTIQPITSPTSPTSVPLQTVAPPLPTMPTGPSETFVRQPAPVVPPITTPISADVMAPTPTYTVPNYGYATPQAAPNPQYSPTRWTPEPEVSTAPSYPARTYETNYVPPSYSQPTVMPHYAQPMPTATEPTAEVEETPTEQAPAGSMEESLEAQAAAATPWYKRPIVWGIGAAILVGVVLLRK